MNMLDKLNALNKLNKRNKLDKQNKLNGLNKLNKLNKFNELNESNKWNKSSNLNKLTATIPGPLLCFLYTATSFRGLQTFAGPRGQQSIFGWPRGPATDLVRPEAAHGLLSQYIENGATDLVLVAVRQIE